MTKFYIRYLRYTLSALGHGRIRPHPELIGQLQACDSQPGICPIKVIVVEEGARPRVPSSRHYTKGAKPMFNSQFTMRNKVVQRLFAFTLAALALFAGATTASAQANCRYVNGHFSIVPLAGPECTSPVGVCATGSANGGMQGDYISTFTSIVPSQDTPQTAVAFFTANTTVINARSGPWQGDLFFKEAGAFDTTGVEGFSQVISIVGGTGSFTNAYGTLFADGSFNPATGGEADYHGRVCIQ